MMPSRSLRVLTLALLLAFACLAPFAALAAKSVRHHTHTPHSSGKVPAPAVHKRVHHHQGETLAKPEHFLDGVNTERFMHDQEDIISEVADVRAAATPGAFNVGVGMADITGQIAEYGFMGYAVPAQKGNGLQIRQRARAFIFVDANSGAKTEGNRVVYVSLDMCMGFQMVKMGVIDGLKAKYGDLYNHANVLLSGTHTHSTPGGTGGTALVDITTFGFSQENYDAAVNGIVTAISRAHEGIEPATVKIAIGQCDGCNINRSPSAYLLDPELTQYSNNTDHEMTLLRITAKSGRELGTMNFFAVHGTSLNNTNTLVSGDNKGYASLKFEEHINPPGTLPGKGRFVAAFGQSNLGDVSPNTRGPHCPDGTPCDFNTSTCGGKTEGCIASGPGNNMFESQQIIGELQLQAALKLWQTASVELSNGGVDSRWQYVQMQNTSVSSRFTSTGQNATTCRAGMGYSFAAGTIDGPGDFDFTQGTSSPNPFWAFISGFLAKPTAEDIACQQPKPILLPVGEIGPIEWVPYILPEQVFRLGDLWILAVPGEFTTMSGRRLRNMVKQQLQTAGVWTDNSHVVIAGLANSYSHYITTYEEYQQQRYEGASTLYGPHTLALHMQNMAGLVDALVSGVPAAVGPEPIDMRNKTFNFMPPVVWDNPPKGLAFGAVETDVQPQYKIGQTVVASFWGASPRNDLQTESSFLFVQRQQGDSTWETVAVDGNWETRFRWARVGLDQSRVTVEWDIPATAQPGNYRIQTQGVAKLPVSGQMTPYMGTSSTFAVSA